MKSSALNSKDLANILAKMNGFVSVLNVLHENANNVENNTSMSSETKLESEALSYAVVDDIFDAIDKLKCRYTYHSGRTRQNVELYFTRNGRQPPITDEEYDAALEAGWYEFGAIVLHIKKSREDKIKTEEMIAHNEEE